MLLSDAILLGSVSTVQGHGHASIGDVVWLTKTRCALGAAADVMGFPLHANGVAQSRYTAIMRTWPWLGQEGINSIWSMNDTQRMTRPAIAAVVAQWERAAIEAGKEVDSVPVHNPQREEVNENDDSGVSEGAVVSGWRGRGNQRRD